MIVMYFFPRIPEDFFVTDSKSVSSCKFLTFQRKLSDPRNINEEENSYLNLLRRNS